MAAGLVSMALAAACACCCGSTTTCCWLCFCAGWRCSAPVPWQAALGSAFACVFRMMALAMVLSHSTAHASAVAAGLQASLPCLLKSNCWLEILLVPTECHHVKKFRQGTPRSPMHAAPILLTTHFQGQAHSPPGSITH